MKRLARIVRSAAPSTAVQFRGPAYGNSGIEDFLLEVLAMANASIDGSRYIVTGVAYDSKGQKHIRGIDRSDFSGKPAYQALANEHIEPPIRLRYHAITVDGVRVGVYEIGDCQDRPYMMRIDYSETLRRGDAYARLNESSVKLGRRQLQSMFEKKFRDSVSAASIEVGFAGSIIHKDRKLSVRDLSALPSTVASAKLNELIEAKSRVHASAANTMVARLTHARLFGTDCPYEERSTDELLDEIRQVEKQYRDFDDEYLFEQQVSKLQLVVLNQGEEALHDTSITLLMPSPNEFHVADRLPRLQHDGQFIDRTPAEQATYPAVASSDKTIQVSVNVGDISPGAPVEVFETPLRICAGSALRGRRIGIQYSLRAQNLRTSVKGTLRLLF